jgi:hypothetical protein
MKGKKKGAEVAVPLAACDQYFNCGSTVQFDILTFAPGTKI